MAIPDTSMTYAARDRKTFTFTTEVAATSGGIEAFTVTIGTLPLTTGKMILVIPRATLDAGLLMSQPPRITALNQITFFWYNTTVAGITPTAFEADILVF